MKNESEMDTLLRIRSNFIGAEDSTLTHRERNILRNLNYCGLFPSLLPDPETDSLKEIGVR